jgi:hypothetical protein
LLVAEVDLRADIPQIAKEVEEAEAFQGLLEQAGIMLAREVEEELKAMDGGLLQIVFIATLIIITILRIKIQMGEAEALLANLLVAEEEEDTMVVVVEMLSLALMAAEEEDLDGLIQALQFMVLLKTEKAAKEIQGVLNLVELMN